MRLLLTRHGQTPTNVLGQLDTAHPGPGLTALGRKQAAVVPDALADEPIEALFASTLVRTQLTAAPLARARGLDVEVRTGLHEIEAGDLEARSDKEAVASYLKTVFAWGMGELDVTMPGGTNGHDFFDRYDADLETIAASGAEAAAVFSHGAAIRVWVAARAKNVPPSFAADNHLENTGIIIVDGSFEHGWSLSRWAGQPVGGPQLADAAAPDPAGESLDEALDQ